jgi:hypothetical protein
MPRSPKPAKRGRRKTGRISVNVRMAPQTKALLDQATLQLGLDSFSSYIEQAILERLQRDKLFERVPSKSASKKREG